MEEIGVINFDTDEGKNQYYFADIGVANYYMSRTGTPREKKVAQLTDVEKGRFVHTCQ